MIKIFYTSIGGLPGSSTRQYTYIPTGICVSQVDPMSRPLVQVHAELRRQLAEKVAAQLASRSEPHE